MKNFVIVIWLIFAAFFIFPMAANYLSGVPESEVISIIEKESEADGIKVVDFEEHGNKAMYVFSAGDDFGTAVFFHVGDKYKYMEGTMSNGDTHIDIHLDTGWDAYEYRITDSGARETDFQKNGGVYRTYAIIALIMVLISIAAAVNGVRMKKKHEEQRKKGLRQ